MIVKVQLSLWSAMDGEGNRDRMALIYDKDRSFLIETMAKGLPGLVEAMDGRERAYFEAEMQWKIDERCQRIHEVTIVHVRDCSCRRTLKFKEPVDDQDW